MTTVFFIKHPIKSALMKTLCFCMSAGFGYSGVLPVSERSFPVAYDVDVLVVGGTSGGVASAVKAAQSGSTVFLMSQSPYLGEDICGTYRLWADENPAVGTLASDVLKSPEILDYKRNSFTYETDIPSAAAHPDSGDRLTDGKMESAEKDTVQYDGDVNIVATLPDVQQVDKIKLYAFQRPNEYCALFVDVYVSNDKKKWDKVGTQKDIEYVTRPMTFSINVDRKAKYVRFEVKKAPQSKRMLISEVEILSAEARTLKAGEQYPPVPLHVKRTLDDALLGAGVSFLYGCYPTDLLTDGSGAVRGVIMANRAGRQIIRAKTIIDATPNALLVRIAGQSFRSQGTTRQFKHTIVTASPKIVPGVKASPSLTPIYHQGEEYPAVEYTLPFDAASLDIHSYAEAQQQMLDKVWTPGQLSASEYLFEVPAACVVSRGRYEGDENVPLSAFEVAGLPGVYVLSGYADVTRACAEKLLKPVQYMKTGEQIGEAAAQAAKKIAGTPALTPLFRSGDPAKGELRETLAGVRPEQPVKERVSVGGVSYPVLGEYDVVVVGGGTSGGPATIGAARRGAKTLVIEYQHGFGGVGTVGLIGRYWYGYVKGFTQEVDVGVRGLRPEGAPQINGWDIADKMEWYRREMRKAGVEMWMRSMAWGAVVDGTDVRGVAVSTPFGTGIVLAKVVVDSTGNGDISIAAGAQYEYLKPSRIVIQGVGLPVFNLGDHYNNSDFSMAYESDAVDNWHLKVYGKSEYRTGDAYDVSSLVDTRERRRVIGDYFLTVPDQLMGRVYTDTVARAFSDYDCHGVNFNRYVFLQPNPDALFSHVPYRCLLPKGLNGILMTGMGISVHSDALPLIRMQADLQNQGYAAGSAAGMAAEAGVPPRNINIRELQQYLVEVGNLPQDVLTDKDVYPVSAERVKEAIEKAPEEYGQKHGTECAIILAHDEISRPMMKQAYQAAQGTNKLFYAHVLAVLEDATGIETLVDYVNNRKWDKGNRAPTSRMSEMDRLVIALGLPADRRATEAVVRKINQLGPGSEFTHFRAVAIALDHLKDPAAAPALAALLGKPGMTGYAIHTIAEARAADEAALNRMGPRIQEAFSFEVRMQAAREISLARALYRCGDYQGMGRKILEDYLTDLRGVLSAHAISVLSENPGP